VGDYPYDYDPYNGQPSFFSSSGWPNADYHLFYDGSRWIIAETLGGAPTWVSSQLGASGYHGPYYNVVSEDPDDNLVIDDGPCENTAPAGYCFTSSLGMEEFEGYYSQTGTYNGRPYYTNSNGKVLWGSSGSTWYLSNGPGGSPSASGPATSVAPDGGAWTDSLTCTEGECASEDCTLIGVLSVEDLGEGDYLARVAITGATGAALTFFKDGAPLTPGQDGLSAPFTLTPGASATIAATAQKAGCEPWGDSITLKNSDEPDEGGPGGCSLGASLLVTDLGGGAYKVTPVLSGATTNRPTLLFVVDTVAATADDDGSLPVLVEVGDSKRVILVASEGDCVAMATVDIANGDSGTGGVPDVPLPDDGCAARLGIYTRDIEANTSVPDAVIWNARIGLEVRGLCANPACQYWFQLFDSSDASLFGDYSPEALAKHFPIAPGFGASFDASGDRLERYQVLASAISRPATTHKHFRIKATPVFQKVPFELDGHAIKIRDEAADSLFIFTQGEARAYRWKAPDKGKYGPGEVEPLVDLATLDAADANDACIVGDKIYVVAPGELFVVDLGTGEATLNSGIRGETRTAAFVENVDGSPLAIYQDEAQTPKVRCYNLSFPTPRLAWTLDRLVTATQVAGGKLLLAAGNALYSSNAGTGAPLLDHTFGAQITALAADYVGLADNHIWRKKSSGWESVETLTGPVGALWPWLGGAQELRALADAASGPSAATLRAEQTTLNWTGDITLEDSTGLRSMRALSIQTAAGTATSPPQADEWMLIGDDNAKLWVYSRTPLSEADGAFKACDVGAARVFPLIRRA
jgi:hypothetical protein